MADEAAALVVPTKNDDAGGGEVRAPSRATPLGEKLSISILDNRHLSLVDRCFTCERAERPHDLVWIGHPGVVALVRCLSPGMRNVAPTNE